MSSQFRLSFLHCVKFLRLFNVIFSQFIFFLFSTFFLYWVPLRGLLYFNLLTSPPTTLLCSLSGNQCKSNLYGKGRKFFSYLFLSSPVSYVILRITHFTTYISLTAFVSLYLYFIPFSRAYSLFIQFLYFDN